MTKLAFINIFLLQIFFIRLTKAQRGLSKGETTETRWMIMYWVAPFTGWWSDYKFIGKQRFLNLTDWSV